MLHCMVNGLLIVRSPVPVMLFVLLKNNVEGITSELFKLNVFVLLKFPVPLITEPAL